MKLVLKSAFAALAASLVIFLTFSLPQALFILVRRSSETGPGAPNFPLKPIFALSSIPAIVGGLIAFFSFWYYFHLSEQERKKRQPR